MSRDQKDRIKALANLMRHAKGSGKPFAVLTGAGCSFSAGIPLAGGILEAINASDLGEDVRQRLGVSDVAKASYGAAMEAITADERKQIIGPFLEKAKINWGHIALGLMMKGGFVGRVLTFNFDSVLVRACGLIGLYPAIYDFSVVPDSAEGFDYIAKPSIIHLHGQGTGLAMMNSTEETERHAQKLLPLFKDTLDHFDLIVTGYSGLADGAFERLCEPFCGRKRLYWLSRGSGAAPVHVRRLTDDKRNKGSYWGEADFDGTMVDLARELGVFPPTIFTDPARHLLAEIAPVAEPPASIRVSGLMADLRKRLKQWEGQPTSRASQRFSLLLEQMWQDAIDLGPADEDDEEDRENLAWAYASLGADQAEQGQLEAAFTSYQRALDVKSDMPPVLNDWGNGLVALARQKQDEGLFQKAFEKYALALEIKPNMPEALNNWGAGLSALAQQKKEKGLFQKAFEKYAQALEIKPDMHEVLFNWGNGLGELARQTKDEAVFRMAFEKFAQALYIKPDMPEVLNNWGSDLCALYHVIGDSSLLNVAGDKLRRAQELGHDVSYSLACLYALQDNEEGCRVQLLACKADGTLPDALHLMDDPDLAAYRDRDWFKALVDAAA